MKIKKANLDKINEIVAKLREANQSIGVMETNKIKMINEAMYWDNEYNTFKAEMVEKYGEDVKIDMSDGSISDASKTLTSVKED
tara:strand:- start:346 stop:597 length:252 start_codon:yes stop_codon:yes gene_type:complete